MSTATPIVHSGPNDERGHSGPRLTQRAQRILGAVLRPGDWAVDATVGRGRDTLFLAHAVGPTGRVIGCDIQRSALEIAAARLRGATPGTAVDLIHGDHARLAERLRRPAPRGASRPW